MKYIKLIIFDLDGTLVDSKDSIASAVCFVLKEVGAKEKGKTEIISYIGSGVDDLIRKSLGKDQEHLFATTKAIFEDYRKRFPNNSPLYPGVKKMLEYFQHKRKAIVTNRKREFALVTLKALNIYDYFEDITGGDDVECMKPSSCPLDKTLLRFNMDKEATMIVGDMDLDILAGKEAGIVTCAVTYGIGRKEDIIKTKPDYIIDDILKLKEIIN